MEESCGSNNKPWFRGEKITDNLEECREVLGKEEDEKVKDSTDMHISYSTK